MDQVENRPPFQGRGKKILWIVLLIVILLALGGYCYGRWFRDSSEEKPGSQEEGVAVVNIPDSVLNNKFGFLSAGADDYEFIKSVGAAWIRPHPGVFVWGRSQTEAAGEISYSFTDKELKRYKNSGLGIIATIWPFAEWDQIGRTDQADCQVSQNDEFAPGGKAEKKGEQEGLDPEMYGRGYLPLHRCAPSDWIAYQKWVAAMVERYDGDGKNDTPGLTLPIKYWEVMNEPDLSSPDGIDRLKFWKDTPEAYAELLIKTNKAVKAADPEAKVVIAGAASGSSQFLNFYRQVLAVAGAKEAFDIGNVHCISSDNIASFNVEPYQAMMAEFGLTKPIWVTEAQALISSEVDINATQALNSTKKAFQLGASKIFYTQYSFEQADAPNLPQNQRATTKMEISGRDPEAAYKQIIELAK